MAEENKDEHSSVEKKSKESKSQKTYTRYEENLEIFDRWKSSRFWLIRVSYLVAASVWTIAIAIGGFIAWLIATLFI